MGPGEPQGQMTGDLRPSWEEEEAGKGGPWSTSERLTGPFSFAFHSS